MRLCVCDFTPTAYLLLHSYLVTLIYSFFRFYLSNSSWSVHCLLLVLLFFLFTCSLSSDHAMLTLNLLFFSFVFSPDPCSVYLVSFCLAGLKYKKQNRNNEAKWNKEKFLSTYFTPIYLTKFAFINLTCKCIGNMCLGINRTAPLTTLASLYGIFATCINLSSFIFTRYNILTLPNISVSPLITQPLNPSLFLFILSVIHPFNRLSWSFLIHRCPHFIVLATLF